MLRLVVAILVVMAGMASAETLGNWRYTAPGGWAAKTDGDHVIYSKVEETTFCMVTVFSPRTPQADLATETAKEWDFIVVKNFTPAEIKKLPAKTTANKLTVQGTGARVTSSDQQAYYAILDVISGGGMIGSVLVMSTSEEAIASCQPHAQRVIDSIAIDAPATAPAPAPAPALVGRWAKGSSSPQNNRGTSDSGSSLHQYELRADGTYRFHLEAWGGSFKSNEWFIVDETGTYTVSGTNLTITPKSATGVVRNRDGAVTKTVKPPMETVTYTWKMHLFSGIGDTQLVLSTSTQTARDGAFVTVSDFPSSYLYSTKYQPGWRFKF